MTRPLFFLLLASMLLPSAGSATPAAKPDARPEITSEVQEALLRQDLLRRINEERRRAGAPPLRFSEPLTKVAQQHAGEIEDRGSLRLEQGSTDVLNRRIGQAGYDAREWAESLASSSGSAASVLQGWKSNDRDAFRKLMDPAYRDLGIGLGRLRNLSLYTFLFAVPESEAFGRETAELRDLARIRAAMLAEVNAVRRRAGVGALRADPELDRAAQRHAADMLARGYFAHKSPDGTTVRERSQSLGYDWKAIGENIAEGQLSVGEVMDNWMKSPGHRRNLLDASFAELGVGLALGRGRGGYRILWVQNFGRPR